MNNPFIERIASAVAPLAGLPLNEVAASLTQPPDPKMGDYSFPCFALAKTWRKKPNEIAQELVDKLAGSGAGRVQAVGPYLNFHVNRAEFVRWILSEVNGRGERFGWSEDGAGKTVVVDFSSPNICKHLGIYHVRNTMVGHAICRLRRAEGWKVVGINHLGDWGTQFGLLIAAYRKWGGESLFEGDAVGNLQDLYVRANDEAKADESFAEGGRAWFRKLEQGDEEALALWQRFRDVSLAAFMEVYEVLGVSFDVIGGESLVREDMAGTVARVKEKGLAETSDGALIVDLSDAGMPPLMLLKSDGATRYETRDLATAEKRYAEYAFDQCVYVTGQDQKLYFRQLFETLRRMGYEWAGNLVHVAHGMIRLSGERMRTRTGGAVKLRDVLAEAVEREREIIENKNPDLPGKENIARQVAVGSVIFHDLKRETTKDIDFEWDEVLRWEGDTGAYVMYTHARLCSILRKYGKPVQPDADASLLSTPEDYALARKVADFPAEVARASEKLEPFILTRYLLDLCAVLSGYYSKHKVLCEDERLAAARVLLMDTVRHTIGNGLDILGIEAPEEM